MTCNINHGDCREVLKLCADAGIMFDACVTDPPYHLTSIVKRFGSKTAAPAKFGSDGAFARASKGFMGQEWDGGDVAFQSETWEAVYNVMKPGAYLLAFGGTRTYHRLACAIEDGGFDIRDTILWHYGSGFPKSHNQGDGRGTALKPATEIIAVARKPFAGTVATNLEKWGTGALNIDACRVELASDDILQNGVQHTGKKLNTGMADTDWGFKAVDREKGLGRWPANLIHDGSDEVLALFPKSKGQLAKSTDAQRSKANVYGIPSDNGKEYQPRNDSGSAARFFYCAKANKKDRAGSTHPTVKPIDLIRYLCRLITPPNGLILDPFAGSGTTGQAAHEEGFNSYLIEQSNEYIKHIQKRMEMLN